MTELAWITPTQLLDVSRIDYVEILTYSTSYARFVHIHTHAGGLLKVEVPGTGADVTAEESQRLATRWVIDNLHAPDQPPFPGDTP